LLDEAHRILGVSVPEDNIVKVEADGLPYNDVGVWTEAKHRLVGYYAALFSAGMKDKWKKRIYIELYAGAGYSRIRGTERIIAGSPIQALGLKVPFDKYIFCEQNPAKLEALRVRVRRHAPPSADVAFIPEDCDSNVSQISAAIPQHSKNHKVLSLCFVDPNDIGIRFSTLQTLALKYVDYVVLLALYMDALRAEQQYIKNPSKIDQLLGTYSWLDRWKIAKQKGAEFPRFLAEEFAASMATMKYIPPPFYSMRKIFLYEKNIPLYAVGLFSRHPLAYELWDKALKGSDDQLGLF
jgi:three-Cys-motif partner protein